MGIAPQDIKATDFRIKDQSQPANRYSTYAKGTSREKVVPTNQLFGADWGAGAFKYKACDFCDDVFAETADLVLGDAWLPEYVQDSYGTNVVVTRNQDLRQLIVNARTEGRLEMDDLGVEKAVESQDAGLRHRKVAIGYRIHCEQMTEAWVPVKRTAPTKTLEPAYEMKRQRLRSELRALSHESLLKAKSKGSLADYLGAMKPVHSLYARQGRSFVRRVLSFVKRRLKVLIRFWSSGRFS